MCKTTPKGLITRIVTHYVSVIDRQRKFYTSLAALAHEGRLKSRHEYVFFLVAALSGPRAPSNNGWLSYTHLDPTVVDGPAKFAGMFKCAAGNTQFSFQGRRIHVGADTLTIDALAPTGETRSQNFHTVVWAAESKQMRTKVSAALRYPMGARPSR